MKIKIKKHIIVIWLTTLLIYSLTVCFNIYPGDWYFKAPLYYNLFWSIHFCSLVALFVIPFLSKKTYIVLGILTSIIWLLIIFFQFNPIDTSTYPKDIKIINRKNSIKYVVREKQNMKTLWITQDTVWVEDKFIFRRIINDKLENNSTINQESKNEKEFVFNYNYIGKPDYAPDKKYDLRNDNLYIAFTDWFDCDTITIKYNNIDTTIIMTTDDVTGLANDIGLGKIIESNLVLKINDYREVKIKIDKENQLLLVEKHDSLLKINSRFYLPGFY